jgi:hypothetical protein
MSNTQILLCIGVTVNQRKDVEKSTIFMFTHPNNILMYNKALQGHSKIMIPQNMYAMNMKDSGKAFTLRH